jgi:hypothetical protein
MDVRDTPTAALLAEIEKFLRKTGMAPSAFGEKALSDPSLINNLRDGRELRFRTMQKVRAFMDAATPTRQRQSA